MTKMDRRSLLTGLAAAPLLLNSALGPSSSRNDSAATHRKRTLNVYLHGAVVIDARGPCLRILAPKTYQNNNAPAHIYRAGYLPNREGGLVTEGEPLVLTGFKGEPSAFSPDPTAYPCFKCPDLKGDQDYFTLVAPVPRSICPLRTISLDSAKTPFFTDTDFTNFESQNLQNLPTLLRLDYTIRHGEKPVLVGSDWQDSGLDPVIIHVRAEPGDFQCANHNAMGSIGYIVGHPNFGINSNYSKCDAPTVVEEEKGFLEICYEHLQGCDCTGNPNLHPHLPETSKPANCVGVVGHP
jgi:hypothetical protein